MHDAEHVPTYITSSAKKRNQGALDHILVDTDAPDRLLHISILALNVRRGLDGTTLTNGVLLVVNNVQIDANMFQGIRHTRDGTIAPAMESDFLAVRRDDALKDTRKILGFLCSARCGWRRRL